MPTTDQWLYFVSLCAMAILFAYSVYKISLRRNEVTYVGVVVSTLLLGRYTSVIIYSYLLWQ
ncbi:hypothetical protein HK405_002126, partial [Cladochytrium tenue]